jgi:hypothetical protein
MKTSSKTRDKTPMSTREMQAYGVACLVKFCAVKKITSPYLSELLEHLLNLLTCADLTAWEAGGSRLALAGRGDPLPEDLSREISPDNLEPFRRLVEHVVEIGLVDMYGAETSQPLQFLNRTQEILRSTGISPPSVDELWLLSEKNTGWGEPLSIEKSEQVKTWCLRHWQAAA